MFLYKINKVKRKFKLELTVAKFKYEPMDKIEEKEDLFKLKMTRGSHKIQIFSHHVHHGKIKFSKTEYQIPMTLYYDEDDKAYLQKELEVKAYMCDVNGNVVRAIGKTQLNIAEYVQNDRFALEVEIQGEDKKQQERATAVFHMQMHQQDDDSKSVNTYSDEQSQGRVKQSRFKQKTGNKTKTKDSLVTPVDKGNMSVKSAQQKLQNNFSSEADEKYSYQDTKPEVDEYDSSKKASRSKVKRDIPKPEKAADKVDDFFNRFDLKAKQQKNSDGGSKKNRESPKNQQPEVQNPRETETTPILKQYLDDSRLKVLQKQNSHLRSENERLRLIVQNLVSQKSQKQISEHTENDQYLHQIAYYKKVIIEKQMKVNELENMQKIILSRQSQKQQDLKEEKKYSKVLKERLEREKLKMANILQTAMQQNDAQLIDFIQTQIQEDNDFY